MGVARLFAHYEKGPADLATIQTVLVVHWLKARLSSQAGKLIIENGPAGSVVHVDMCLRFYSATGQKSGERNVDFVGALVDLT